MFNNSGQFDKAIADYTETIRIDDQHEMAYMNRAEIHVGQERFAAAVADYTQAISINPESAMAFYNRGRAYRALGNEDEALSDYSTAIRLNPSKSNISSVQPVSFQAKR
jgi:tetratricopeptide (TPR) repeat protein